MITPLSPSLSLSGRIVFVKFQNYQGESWFRNLLLSRSQIDTLYLRDPRTEDLSGLLRQWSLKSIQLFSQIHSIINSLQHLFETLKKKGLQPITCSYQWEYVHICPSHCVWRQCVPKHNQLLVNPLRNSLIDSLHCAIHNIQISLSLSLSSLSQQPRVEREKWRESARQRETRVPSPCFAINIHSDASLVRSGGRVV